MHREIDESELRFCYRFEIGYMDSLRYEIEKEVERTIKKYLTNELDKNKNM